MNMNVNVNVKMDMNIVANIIISSSSSNIIISAFIFSCFIYYSFLSKCLHTVFETMLPFLKKLYIQNHKTNIQNITHILKEQTFL